MVPVVVPRADVRATPVITEVDTVVVAPIVVVTEAPNTVVPAVVPAIIPTVVPVVADTPIVVVVVDVDVPVVLVVLDPVVPSVVVGLVPKVVVIEVSITPIVVSPVPVSVSVIEPVIAVAADLARQVHRSVGRKSGLGQVTRECGWTIRKDAGVVESRSDGTVATNLPRPICRSSQIARQSRRPIARSWASCWPVAVIP